MKTLVSLLFGVAAAAAAAASAGAAAAADPAAGEQIFSKCRACHQIGESAHNMVGPVLNGIVGRKAGTYPDYSYSAANKNSGIVWGEATFKEYIKDPKAKIPGTKMMFAGIKNDDEANNLWAYLKQFDAEGNVKK